VPFRVFLFYDGLAALISVPLIIGAVYLFGDQVDHVMKIIKNVEHGILGVIAVIILLAIGQWYLSHRKLKQKGLKK
jgi:membrane protein DedA with SNARE-associated domain